MFYHDIFILGHTRRFSLMENFGHISGTIQLHPILFRQNILGYMTRSVLGLSSTFS